MQIALATSFMMKEEYSNALEAIKIIQDYDFSKHTKLIPLLIDRQNMTRLNEMFIYSKLKNNKKMEDVLKIIQDENNPEILENAHMILLLNKGNKTCLKQLCILLNEKAESKMILACSNIHYAIKREYQKLK